MSPARVVVDGSNIATEGRSRPSLSQLDEAVRAFLKEHPNDEVTVVVDATFGHRIDSSERQQYEEAVDAGEVISPPAGAVGRGDAFILTIAEKTDAIVLSNDSFQEFHGEHPWLFDSGRLMGGKPVPEVGWIFQERVPVRGPKSRKAVRDARDDEKKSKKGPSTKSTSRRGRGRGRKKAEEPGEAEEAESGKKGGAGKGGGKGGRGRKASADRGDKGGGRRATRGKGGGSSGGRGGGGSSTRKPQEPINPFEAFIEFAAAHPPGSLVTAEVAEYSSHGAYAESEGLRCYIPIKRMGDPIPRAARDVVTTGEVRDFVVNELDAPRRAVELAVPGFETVERIEPATAEEAELPIDGYDDMTARQITGALGNLDLEELEALATYEEAHDNRKTVMRAVETRIERVRHDVEEAADKALAKKKPAAKKRAAKKRPAKKKSAGKKKGAAKKGAAKKKGGAKKKAPAKRGAAKKKSAGKKKGAAKKKS